MLIAGARYNLKKLTKYTQKKAICKVERVKASPLLVFGGCATVTSEMYTLFGCEDLITYDANSIVIDFFSNR